MLKFLPTSLDAFDGFFGLVKSVIRDNEARLRLVELELQAELQTGSKTIMCQPACLIPIKSLLPEGETRNGECVASLF